MWFSDFFNMVFFCYNLQFISDKSSPDSVEFTLLLKLIAIGTSQEQ